MEKFVPKYRNGAWPAGGVLHVYVCPRAGVDDDLLELAQRCRSAISEYPIDPQYPDVPGDPGWLHLTVEMIADTPTSAISDEEKAKLVSELTQELTGLPGFGTEVGPPIGNVAGCVLDVWPEDQVRELGSRVRAAVVRARGEDAIQHSGGRPHMSIGYSYAAASSDKLNSKLRNTVIPRRASLWIDRVYLLDVMWTERPIGSDGTLGWQMTWTCVAEIPLAG
ncbi:2'-5' RNA ligase family protein [Streptomyces sp. NPDC048161]|uniref:2'-5' RNA ligase family protein n=1 Tax=Streptomyces sp. NPDC048161 TaxID=3160985 RepID=UPI0033CBA688